jgi:hypothetical protein
LPSPSRLPDEIYQTNIPSWVASRNAIAASPHTSQPFNLPQPAVGLVRTREIGGYCGERDTLDRALAQFAEAYGDQTERDHADLVKAIKSGRVPAVAGEE